MYRTNTLPLRGHIFVFLLLLAPFLACTQAPATANEVMPPALGDFDYGVNMGYFPPEFYDKELAALVHGVPGEGSDGYGITSIRPGLFNDFLEFWGYDIRKPHFEYYDSIGLRNTVVISGYPSPQNRDSAFYCPGEQSRMFRDMYLPIWDNGAYGTPVNENNPYALYIWRAATTYKGLIKIWEVWNEPDFDTGNGHLPPGMPGNWWDQAPQPCETAIKAPPFFYIRALRITYEVVKSIDPEALVAVGGLGYPSFLDVICRYTDNPFTGEKDDTYYPFTGGAYFDCMSFHAYPHFNNSLRAWNDETGKFDHSRHSDAATAGIWKQRDAFRAVLDKYGYDGAKYPEKRWICSEFNIPRKTFGEYIGSEEAQVNFMIKTLVSAQQSGMAQMHVYSIADEPKTGPDHPEFGFMGLFKNLENVGVHQARPNALAYAIKTTRMLLDQHQFDATATAALALPENIGGAVFRKGEHLTYILWAKTTLDRSETASAVYHFPPDLGLRFLEAKPWDYSRNNNAYLVNARQVYLTGSPVFLTETHITNDYPKQLKVSPNPAPEGMALAEFWIFAEAPSSLEVFDGNGRLIQTLIDREKLIEGPHARLINLSAFPNGTYFVRLATPDNNNTVRVLKQ